mgnify:CR=1 FL=1
MRPQAEANIPKADARRFKADAGTMQANGAMGKAKKKKAKAFFWMVSSDGKILPATIRIIKAIL